MEKCGLHGAEAPLCDSHLMPKALYRLLGPGSDAVVATAGGSRISGQQVKDHFLCRACEQLLSRSETYVIDRCLRINDGRFVLLDALRSSKPLDGRGIFELGSVSNVDSAQFLLFAAGVFWKAAAQNWKAGRETIRRMDLGPYTSQLQQYLLGNSAWPSSARLVLHVMADQPPQANAIILPKKTRNGSAWQQTFVIPGITFILFIGGTLPNGFSSLPPETVIVFLGPATEVAVLAGIPKFLRRIPSFGRVATHAPANGRSRASGGGEVVSSS